MLCIARDSCYLWILDCNLITVSYTHLIPHVIIEIGEKREITGELIVQIDEGIEKGLNNLPARPMAVKGTLFLTIISIYRQL